MIRIGLLMLMVVLLPGCTIYHAIGDDFGSYVAPPSGQEFQPVGYRWDYEHTALIYVYRPGTTWSNDELETPSFYMNDERLFNIKGDGYTWYELEPGNHEIIIRRPLMGLSGIKFSDTVGFTLKEVAQLELNAEAGKVYYLRYSEVDQDAALFKNMTFNKNPLEVVTPDIALAEIKQTQMIHHGRGLVSVTPDTEDLRLAEAQQMEQMQEAEATTESSWNPF
ncbi:MAG: DUF2846 domain-containing protein [Oleispira sp.]|nr:DUF2846 domain-containing protein [Oleispira sp.]MBL4881051.1 DUF2846 domain-containing protein [Oleispira sp.]